jgi:TRAP-type C4-dicarboxylate transport system permease small subunit
MLNKIAKAYLKIVEGICVALLLMILGCMVIQIICRLLVIGQNFTEELSRLCFSVMIFLAAPMCLVEGADICVDMVVNMLPKPVRKVVDLVAYALMAAFSLIALYSENIVINTNKGVTAVSMTWIKMNWLYYIFAFSFVCLFIVNIWKIVVTLKDKPQTYDINAAQKAKAIEEAKELDLGI